MIDFKLGAILLFLLPGLCTFSSYYGLFGHIHSAAKSPLRVHRGGGQRAAFAPPPPAANSIKTLTIIVGASLAANLATAALCLIRDVAFATFCDTHYCLPLAMFDPYQLAVEPSGATPSARHWVAGLFTLVVIQSVAAFYLPRFHLLRAARENRLPSWLYGWTAHFANQLDDDDKIVAAVVVTKSDVDVRVPGWRNAPLRRFAIAYTGAVGDLAVGSDGAVKRINLRLCQRFLLDLASESDSEVYEPLSYFDYLTIDASQIRNVTLEIVAIETGSTDAGSP